MNPIEKGKKENNFLMETSQKKCELAKKA